MGEFFADNIAMGMSVAESILPPQDASETDENKDEEKSRQHSLRRVLSLPLLTWIPFAVYRRQSEDAPYAIPVNGAERSARR